MKLPKNINIYFILLLFIVQLNNLKAQCNNDVTPPEASVIDQFILSATSFELEIWAQDFFYDILDNCSPLDKINYSFSETEYVPSLVIPCGLGINKNITVKTYLSDEQGNTNMYEVNFQMVPNETCDPPILNGYVTTPNGQPIPNTTITYQKGLLTINMITNETGHYHLATDDFPIYNLKFSNNNSSSNLPSTLDFVKIQRHLLGIEPFDNDFDLIAADINLDHTITIEDLILLKKIILGVIPNPHTELYFFHESTDFSDPSSLIFSNELQIEMSDFIESQNFIGIRIGEIGN